MWFGTLILKNIVRRPVRSILTVVAIAIAIGSVVSLVGIANGFEATFYKIYDRKGVDIFVVQAGRDRRASSLPEALGQKLRALPGVKQVIPGLMEVVSFEEYKIHTVVVQGWIPETAVFDHLTVLEGRLLNSYDERDDHKSVMLGSVLARNLGKKVGDTIEIIEGQPFEIVGIHETNNVFENGAMVVPLKQVQRIFDRKDHVTGYSLVLDKEMKKADPDLVPHLRTQIEGLMKGISALSTQDHIGSLTELRVVKAMAWITSAIALAIGLFGVMNTMVMAVNERTREIGILRAVGWRPYRVLRLVLFEAIALSLTGAVFGVIGAIILVRFLTQLPTVAGLIDGHIQPIFFVYGFVIAAVVGLLGGIFPARRAAGMLPTAALRQE
jgi:putative ABC transport system permease protein